jgi:hypothetical protein
VRHGNAPARGKGVRGERAGVVAVGAAFQAVKQRELPAGARVSGEIDVDEIAVGRLPALAREREPRGRAQRRIDRLQVPARQPPWRNKWGQINITNR